VAFVLTTALSYVTALVHRDIRIETIRGAFSIACGVVYALLGTIDYGQLRSRGGRKGTMVYLGVQAILVFGILYSARMVDETFLSIFSLVATIVTLLSRSASRVAVAVVYGLMLSLEIHFHGPQSILRWSIPMIPSFLFVVIFTRIAMREKEARARAEALAIELEQMAVLQERNRLAREIHDGLGHYLTAIHVQLEGARAVHESDSGRALDAVAQAQRLAREALQEVRRSVGALKADGTTTLSQHLRELASATDGWGANVSLEVLGSERILPVDTTHALFRMAQEGLTNVRKHAQAQNAVLSVDFRHPERVIVSVVDDGRGTQIAAEGHGLKGLRQRLDEFGGFVSASNLPKGGFCLKAEIPS